MARTENHRGRFYELTGGRRYPSVTTILTAINKPALVAWSAKVEREMVIVEAGKLYGELYGCERVDSIKWSLMLADRLGKEKAHTKELAKAGEIGSQIHSLIEWSLRGELLEKLGPSPILSEQAQWGYAAFQRWRQDVNLKPLRVEFTVWSDVHKIAGTADLLAMVEGKLTLLDWKSGKAIYPEAKLQNAAYRRCVREMGLGEVEQGIIVRLPKVLTDPEFETMDAGPETENLGHFLRVKDVWDWMQAENEWLKKQDAVEV